MAFHIDAIEQRYCIARHRQNSQQVMIELDHYLGLLRREPNRLIAGPNRCWATLAVCYQISEANHRLIDWLWWARALSLATWLNKVLHCDSFDTGGYSTAPAARCQPILKSIKPMQEIYFVQRHNNDCPASQ